MKDLKVIVLSLNDLMCGECEGCKQYQDSLDKATATESATATTEAATAAAEKAAATTEHCDNDHARRTCEEMGCKVESLASGELSLGETFTGFTDGGFVAEGEQFNPHLGKLQVSEFSNDFAAPTESFNFNVTQYENEINYTYNHTGSEASLSRFKKLHNKLLLDMQGNEGINVVNTVNTNTGENLRKLTEDILRPMQRSKVFAQLKNSSDFNSGNTSQQAMDSKDSDGYFFSMKYLKSPQYALDCLSANIPVDFSLDGGKSWHKLTPTNAILTVLRDEFIFKVTNKTGVLITVPQVLQYLKEGQEIQFRNIEFRSQEWKTLALNELGILYLQSQNHIYRLSKTEYIKLGNEEFELISHDKETGNIVIKEK